MIQEVRLVHDSKRELNLVENQSLASKTTSGITHCQRFLNRGNKPVPANYEEQEVAQKKERLAMVPQVNHM